jgi:hypothetical protein
MSRSNGEAAWQGVAGWVLQLFGIQPLDALVADTGSIYGGRNQSRICFVPTVLFHQQQWCVNPSLAIRLQVLVSDHRPAFMAQQAAQWLLSASCC